MKLAQTDLDYIRRTGIIILTEELEHVTYETLLEALTELPDREIKLYCRGNGGSSRTARAMVDLIRQHGNVCGMLAGEAASCHASIWSGCPRRYVYPFGGIAIHRVAWSTIDTRVDATYARLLWEDYEDADRWNAQLLADISTRSADDWYKVIEQTGSGAAKNYNAAALIEMGMARPISEYHAVSIEHNGAFAG